MEIRLRESGSSISVKRAIVIPVKVLMKLRSSAIPACGNCALHSQVVGNLSDVIYLTTVRILPNGTSNTVMLGEVRQFAGFDARGLLYLGSAFYAHEFLPNTNAEDSLELCTKELTPDAPCTTRHAPSRGPCRQTARSNHPGGVHLGFVDGHVEFFVDDGDADLCAWQALSTRSGADQFKTLVVGRNGASCQ